MFRHIALAATLSLVAAPVAFAQDTAPAPDAAPSPEAAGIDPAQAYLAARNQLGILKHCQEQGFSGAEAVAAQEKMIGMLPAGDAAAGDEAEQKGAAGTVSIGGTEVNLEEAATGQGTTVEAQCQQIEAAVNQVAAQLPQ
ncbi:pore-forming ESAT-6 family protein [Paracoccus caeni]|uniref:Pore-forming ESAT-6 family protein n=1 Tax=Paracoccus caeni TaxID=657651 RepID=A0A934SF31_9RHOB|nr:pore-forming ESAT-6 family protein [Paracoccus caeni]MBK4216204.1 pore-forming ESAT-6 family protein [Paracoccus caeni]